MATPETAEAAKKSPWLLVRKIVLSPVLWMAGTVVVAAIGWYVATNLDAAKKERDDATRPEKYIAVVMSKADASFTIPTEFLSGFQIAGTGMRAQSDEPVFIKYHDDNYSPSGAEDRAEKLVSDENCVLIIGNSNSELTAKTLEVILRSSNPPSLVMPIATANELTSIADDANYRALLRMVPNNNNQAKQIKSFVASRSKHQRVAILVDEQNRLYSEDLSRDLAAMIRSNGGTIILQKNYGDSQRLIDYSEYLQSQQIDFLIFVGVSNNGLLLVDEMTALKIDTPVFFTDGSTVGELIKRSAQLPGPSYFASAVGNTNGGAQPTYEPIGTDAHRLVQIIISGARHNTRESIRSHIEKDKKDIILTAGGAGEYRFNEKGENIGLDFSIYKNENAELVLQKGY